MTIPNDDRASGETSGHGNKGRQPGQPVDSVFHSDPESDAKRKRGPEHKGVHGRDGVENDLDRAEQAGREGGRR